MVHDAKIPLEDFFAEDKENLDPKCSPAEEPRLGSKASAASSSNGAVFMIHPSEEKKSAADMPIISLDLYATDLELTLLNLP